MMPIVRRIHRYVGLTLLTLWIIQAGTGVLMVFHWELGDALLPGSHRATDWAALDGRVALLLAERPGSQLTAIYPTGGAPNRFDIFLDDSQGRAQVVRVDGGGTVLGEWPSEHDYAHAPWIETAVILHQSLFAGQTGRWLLGASGTVLLINLVLGLKLAWPPKGQWVRALSRFRGLPRSARVRSWHRSLGLWLSLPALVFVTAGVLQAFDDPLEEFLNAAPPAPAASRVGATAIISPGQAIVRALAAFPESTFSGLSAPAADRPWYRVRVKQPGEIRRVFGTTAVYVSTADGRTLGVNNARQVPWRRRFLDATYPTHTGEAAGLPGRLLALASGLLLLSVMVFGVTIWWRQRDSRTARMAGR